MANRPLWRPGVAVTLTGSMDQDFASTLRLVIRNKAARGFPGAQDARVRDGCLFPAFTPKFRLDLAAGATVFTIGSCFARNIEEALKPLGVTLPTQAFRAPKAEFPYRPNGLLNEFNPGSMARRIQDALADTPSPPETIVPSGPLFMDLLLPESHDVSHERAVARRGEIANIYTILRASSVVILTLGLIECWYDHATASYLNRMPPAAYARSEPSRFSFRRLGVATTLALLTPAMEALGQLGIKVVMTVSPVPLQTTFTGEDCVTANTMSKATLRVSAERLAKSFPHVDYYPSYEIVRSGGLSSYMADHVHVRPDLVRLITAHMVDSYAN